MTVKDLQAELLLLTHKERKELSQWLIKTLDNEHEESEKMYSIFDIRGLGAEVWAVHPNYIEWS
jgi:hypothetical protein